MGNIYYSKAQGGGEGETEPSLKLTITLTCDKISEILLWRDGRVVEGGGLENRFTET